MNIRGFIWREEIIDKLDWKHNITPEEVERVFEGKPKFLRKEKGKVEGEDLYNALGRTASGRYLSVFFINWARRPPRLQGRGMNRPIQHLAFSIKIQHLAFIIHHLKPDCLQASGSSPTNVAVKL